MKRFANRVALLLFIIFALPQNAQAAQLLVPVGQVIGLELRDDSVVVAAFDEELGGYAKAAGLKVGDEILDIDGKMVDCAEDVRQALERSDGQVKVQIRRDGKTKALSVAPRITPDGPRLGVYLRQGITGIGTVTWYDPESGQFGTLGHGVTGQDGQVLDMTRGWAYRAAVMSVKKGKCGTPGQLVGALEGQAPIGALDKNTAQGVFGRADAGWEGQALPVAECGEVRTGPATIRSAVKDNKVREYSVEILKIYPVSRENGRNLLLKVTDPALLETTGGIVQGMSGSPIIQDGKFVGAVTHVLVNDPTTGYGIFIENMLDAAG